MAVNLSPVGGVAAQFFTNTGAVLTGGKLYTYLAGTTTPTPTYTTSAGNVARTNPIVLDAAGRVPNSGEIWITGGTTYKFVLTDSNNVLIGTYDNVSTLFNTTSDLVTYTPAGVNAVTTTVQAKLRQTVSVKDFGAVGDNSTDDTVAIQNALDSGNIIYFPTGEYLVSDSLKFNSNQAIYGDGYTKSIITTNTAVTTALIVAKTTGIRANIDDIGIINLGGTAAISVADATKGILGNSNRVRFIGNPCVIGTGNGINPVMSFTNCDFTPFTTSYECIQLIGANNYNNFTVANCIFHCNNSSAFAIDINCTSGLSTAFTNGAYIQNNLFEEASGGAIKLGSPQIANIFANDFDDIFSQTNPLIYIYTSAGSSYAPTQVNISNNNANIGYGSISLTTAVNSIVSGNRFGSVDFTNSSNITVFNNNFSCQYTNYNNTINFFGSNTSLNVPILALGTTVNQVSNFTSSFCIGADLNATNGLMLAMNTASVTKPFVYFQNNIGNQIGSISTTGTAVAYNTSSDRRLKSDIESITTAQSGPIIDALKPRTFIWKSNNTADVGFIADEIQEVIPNAVSGIADAVDEDGKPIYQMLDAAQPEMMAYLVAELQSIRARLKAANID
jgi:hypothetical protein